jgi:hypothetical protein
MPGYDRVVPVTHMDRALRNEPRSPWRNTPKGNPGIKGGINGVGLRSDTILKFDNRAGYVAGKHALD